MWAVFHTYRKTTQSKNAKRNPNLVKTEYSIFINIFSKTGSTFELLVMPIQLTCLMKSYSFKIIHTK